MVSWIKHNDVIINLSNVFFYEKKTFERRLDGGKTKTVYSIQFDSIGNNYTSLEFDSEEERERGMSKLQDTNGPETLI
jgi:hypothetical protein